MTDIYDDNGEKISLGDTLCSVYGYEVIVYEVSPGDWAGKLICTPDHSCANIPYALNKGQGHTIKVGA
jgi:hypothetical protein